MIAILKGCVQLQTLDIARVNVTDVFLKEVPQYGQCLSKLIMSGSQVTFATFQRVQKMCPELFIQR